MRVELGLAAVVSSSMIRRLAHYALLLLALDWSRNGSVMYASYRRDPAAGAITHTQSSERNAKALSPPPLGLQTLQRSPDALWAIA